MTMLDAALAYASMGYAVFPCQPNAKVPACAHGVKDASTDAATIRRWWSERPDCNIGMATAGLLVVDVDAPDGWPADPVLRSALAAAPTQYTPRGGSHHVFRAPAGVPCRNTAGRIAPGVDTRADGGYIVVAPSTVNGKHYTWAEAGGMRPTPDLTEPPAAILDALAPRPTPEPEPVQPPTRVTPPSQAVTDAARARAYAARVPPAAQGQRNAGLNGLAFRLLERFTLDEAEHRAICLEWARLCSPPLPAAEAERTIGSAWTGAQRTGAVGAKRTEPRARQPAPVEPPPQDEPPPDWHGLPTEPDTVPDAEPEAPEIQVCGIDDLLDFKTEADPGTLLGRRWLCRGGGALLIGRTGLGKSSLATQAALSWALGEPLFGLAPVRPLKVLVIQAENDRGDQAEMVQGIVTGLDWSGRRADLRDRFEVVTDASHCGRPFLAFARALVLARRPDLCILDPLHAYAGGDLCKAEVATAFLRNGLNPIAADTGAAFFIVHHTAKPPKEPELDRPKSDYSYAGAGSAELANWARAVLVLRELQTGGYELRAAKRGKRAGLTTMAGDATDCIYLRHGQAGICWQRAEDMDLGERAGEADQARDIVEELEQDRTYTERELRRIVQKGTNAHREYMYRPEHRAYRVFQIVKQITGSPQNPGSFSRPRGVNL